MTDKVYAVKDTSGATTYLHGFNCKKIRRGMRRLMKSAGLRIISVKVVGTYDDKATK